MGISHLSKIASLFMALRSAEEPVAIVQEATTTEQKIVIGTTSDIVALAEEHAIGSPGVIVIGEVVRERGAIMQAMEKIQTIQ
jgi:uroporphyrin-III C-methyltransferase